MVMCLGQGTYLHMVQFAHGPADATATHYLLLQQMQSGFTFLVPAHLGSTGQNPRGTMGHKTVVCVCVYFIIICDKILISCYKV